MMEINVTQAVQWIEKANGKFQENREYLTSLDRPIGDGDHGLNMSRGFKEAVEKVKAGNYSAPADVFKDVAMTLVSKVGGASGPLFGTAFLKMSVATAGQQELNESTFVKGLEAAVDGIKQRGKATTGEKTMVDVWEPVVEWLQANGFEPEGLLAEAERAMNATNNMTATKGRAAYFKEKSVGHIDAGAASSYYVFAALAEVLGGK